MVELAKVILPIIQRFKNIVGYGGSMGGYAAIKYSNLLNMNRIIAFVPQYSIDPEQVEDRRYAEFFDAVANKDMQIQPQDVDASREYIIVYDPYFSIDREHYLKIKEILPSLHTIHLPLQDMKLYLYWQAQAFYMILLSMNLMKRISINKFVKSKTK